MNKVNCMLLHADTLASFVLFSNDRKTSYLWMILVAQFTYLSISTAYESVTKRALVLCAEEATNLSLQAMTISSLTIPPAFLFLPVLDIVHQLRFRRRHGRFRFGGGP